MQLDKWDCHKTTLRFLIYAAIYALGAETEISIKYSTSYHYKVFFRVGEQGF